MGIIPYSLINNKDFRTVYTLSFLIVSPSNNATTLCFIKDDKAGIPEHSWWENLQLETIKTQNMLLCANLVPPRHFDKNSFTYILNFWFIHTLLWFSHNFTEKKNEGSLNYYWVSVYQSESLFTLQPSWRCSGPLKAHFLKRASETGVVTFHVNVKRSWD